MILLELLVAFFMIGLASFGGGYAMIPLIEAEAVTRRGWLDASQFLDAVAVSGMSPGPVATNIAIFIGMREAGLAGAIVAAAGMVLPSLIIIVGAGMLSLRLAENRWLQSAFYGLRSVVTGLIIYAAIVFSIRNGLFSSVSWFAVSQLLIFAGSLAALLIFRKHPLFIIVISGLVGIAVYS